MTGSPHSSNDGGRGFYYAAGGLLSMSGGDWGSLFQLFFDNLSSILGVVYATQGMESFGVSRTVINNTVYGQMIPGIGMTLFLGNLYYSYQAIRLSRKYGRQYTAQPYGINTVQGFSFIYNIMYTVYFDHSDRDGPDDAFIRGYYVILAANFISGFIATILGIFGTSILRFMPPAALLVPIAGVGFAFLGIEQLAYSIAAPLVGYSTVMWVFLGWYSGVKVGIGNYRIPEALMVILVGIALGWITQINDLNMIQDSTTDIKWWGPTFIFKDLFTNHFELAMDYIGIILPLGISAASLTLMCLVSAQEAGDPFPIRETMITDGIGTMIASFFGNPFGSVVYIGHPAHKRSGAKVGYSAVNGIVYLLLSWFGILSLMQSVVNTATIGPIVFFIGLMINEEALNFISKRHYPAYIVGLFPSIYDWVTNATNTTPITNVTLNGDEYNETYPAGALSFIGVLGWKRGSLLVSMIWTAMIVMVIDRKWLGAIFWAMMGAMFAIFGVIHMAEAGVQNIYNPITEQCRLEGGGGDDDDVVCWEEATQVKFFGAYLILAATFGIIAFVARYDDTIGPPIDDPTSHAFDDWFKDAGTPVAVGDNSNNNNEDNNLEKVVDDEIRSLQNKVDEEDGMKSSTVAQERVTTTGDEHPTHHDVSNSNQAEDNGLTGTETNTDER